MRLAANTRTGAARTVLLGEGDPKQWATLGLGELPIEWTQALGSVARLAAAIRRPVSPASIRRVLGGVCIHRSGGNPLDLPITALWEVVTILLVARRLGASAMVLPPIAEEVFLRPDLAVAYRQFGRRLDRAVGVLGTELGVPVLCHEAPRLADAPDIPVTSLYGLFHPFATEGPCRIYPLGRSDEQKILQAHRSYCARYSSVPEGLSEGDLLCEGMHIARSIVLGVADVPVAYLATVPMPAHGISNRQMSAGSVVPAITQPRPQQWDWVDHELVAAVGMPMEPLRRLFFETLEDP